MLFGALQSHEYTVNFGNFITKGQSTRHHNNFIVYAQVT
jgi:hypothetical protein